MKANLIRIDGDIAIITLTRGYETVIDAADLALIAKNKWYAIPDHSQITAYAATSMRIGACKTTVMLHRFILGADKNYVVDHIDGDGMNNRRNNLRLATRQENSMNQRRSKNNKSGFKGVSWVEARQKWHARICLQRQSYHLGLFESAHEAHAAYVAASKSLHKEFGRPE